MSPPPENPPPDLRLACHSGGSVQNEFSPEERAVLLALAHDAILSALDHREISLTAPSPHLAEPRGAFTTLYHRGELHGCVGYVFAVASLYRTVAETARGAAFDDGRFSAVTRDEASDLKVSLSILSPVSAILPEEVEIGRHGLLITHGAHRGLLLPQVPIEHAWDRITFLEQTCRKAALPPNAWQTGATLEAFTAEVFGDRDLGT